MITPSHRIHIAMGAPASESCSERQPFLCWVCAGQSRRGIDRERWLGANFVGQNRVRCPDSPSVCEACVVVMAGRPPDVLRMYSHMVDDRGWLCLTKADKARMRTWLREPKRGEWFAAIADSGQKHVIPWTPINPVGAHPGRVMFEERLVELGDWAIVERMSDLLTAGATKGELSTGEYGPRAWQLCGPSLRAFERAHGSERHGPWFALALWLAQRDEAEVAKRLEAEDAERRRKREVAKSDDRARARRARRVPADGGGQPARALEHAPGEDARGGQDDVERGGVGHGSREDAATGRSQLELFGKPA